MYELKSYRNVCKLLNIKEKECREKLLNYLDNASTANDQAQDEFMTYIESNDIPYIKVLCGLEYKGKYVYDIKDVVIDIDFDGVLIDYYDFINEVRLTKKPILITPKGAAILAKLASSGFLTRKNDSSVDSELEQYLAYGDSYEEYKEKKKQEAYNLRHADEIKEAEDLKYYAKHLDSLPEDKFNPYFIDKLIIKVCGYGSRTLTINGIEMHKNVYRYTSNSGKTADYDIDITFTDKTGEQVKWIIQTSFHALNRRNDPDRNWGLGRD